VGILIASVGPGKIQIRKFGNRGSDPNCGHATDVVSPKKELPTNRSEPRGRDFLKLGDAKVEELL